ncbi:MAG: hypothetical protein ACI4LE_05075 [Faecalibacterium sp.]
MYEEWCKDLMEKYGFRDISYRLSAEDFSVTISLSPQQVRQVQSKWNDLEQFRVKAEWSAAQKAGIPLGQVPKTTIKLHGNQLTITASPYTIESLCEQIFA